MATSYSVCNECIVMNRFDTDRSGSPICGRCKKPLPMTGAVTAATDKGLQRLIESSPIPVVVDFWAPWCGPCLSFAPTFASTATRRLGNAVFAKINTQTEAGAAQAHGIRGIPTLIVFHKSKEVARTSGALDQNSLDRWLDDVGRAMAQEAK
jgi:thioredoxin 2